MVRAPVLAEGPDQLIFFPAIDAVVDTRLIERRISCLREPVDLVMRQTATVKLVPHIILEITRHDAFGWKEESHRRFFFSVYPKYASGTKEKGRENTCTRAPHQELLSVI